MEKPSQRSTEGKRADPACGGQNKGGEVTQVVIVSRMMSSKIVATLLVMYIATMLAAQTEGFVPIFTYSDVQRMQEKERNKGQKKSLSVQQRSEEVDPMVFVNFKDEEENEMIKLTAPVEIGIRMNSRQLEKYQGILEELLTEVLLSTQNG
ncbi:promotilin isoform X1 [Antechinus flavipes]|uniref:promotilin isoform X1 n=2 Tax=Antechinus flavipes TaxID=38775 RepID=UPI002235F10F|nr:promotilin isoform X1 [Antechinus flavipes]